MKFNASGGSENGIDSKNFIRLKNDKQSVVGVFRGDPFDYKTHWISNRTQTCKGSNCSYCANGNKPQFKFLVNFVIYENNQYMVKIFEQGWTVYESMKALNEDFDLEKTIVKITRRGTGRDNTTYSILPIPGNPRLTPERERMIAALSLYDLKELIYPENPNQKNEHNEQQNAHSFGNDGGYFGQEPQYSDDGYPIDEMGHPF